MAAARPAAAGPRAPALSSAGARGPCCLAAAASGAGPRLRRHRARRCAALSGDDLERLVEAAELSQSLTGVTAPHPNAACVLVSPDGRRVGAGVQRAQGSTPAEVLAAREAREAARGATAYVNLETGDCHGDEAAVGALLGAGVARVVVGLRHPLAHLRNKAVRAYAAAGLAVDVLGEAPLGGGAAPGAADAALARCLAANEALLHRAVLRAPLSVLKYAMTLDGKIATAAGHSAWVSSPASRARVFDARAASDAVVVGGNTVRRDDPRLTTRREGGHLPVRVVMSRTLDLPHAANLWDTQEAPTIVMTQRGARAPFQAHLRSRGVEVVEFDFLTPAAVADYCYERGFLQVFWECGGTLAAPAIAGGVIHKVLAFIAPKIIGGDRAPTPVGELGNVEMTQAVSLADPTWQQVGPDLMVTGYLPSSGGLAALEAALSYPGARGGAAGAAAAASAGSSSGSSSGGGGQAAQARPNRPGDGTVVHFYKAWDEWGALSNFSPHAVEMPPGAAGRDAAPAGAPLRRWASVEHYYQAQKFAGVPGDEAAALVEAIAASLSPEEAARLGRRAERERPELLRPDWAAAKRRVMLGALRAKFGAHAGPREMLLSTAGPGGGAGGGGGGGAVLLESSPHDRYWGSGYDGLGANHLGQLLMQVRGELLADAAGGEASQRQAGTQHHRAGEQQQQQEQQQEQQQQEQQAQKLLEAAGVSQQLHSAAEQAAQPGRRATGGAAMAWLADASEVLAFITDDDMLQIAGAAALLSAVTYSLAFKASALLSPRLCANYRRLSASEQADWDSRLPSTLHAVVVVALGLWSLAVAAEFADAPGTPGVLRTSGLSFAVVGLSGGYFAMDLALLAGHPAIASAEMVLHHGLALLSLATAAQARVAHVYLLAVLLSEATTPCVNVRWWMDKAGRRDLAAYKVNGLCLLLVWGVARVAAFAPFAAHVAANFDHLAGIPLHALLLLLGVPVVLFALNTLWFVKIVRGAIKLVAPPRPGAAAASAGAAGAGAGEAGAAGKERPRGGAVEIMAFAHHRSSE
ncbi:hypothetical protein HT031_004509 [Scenedesmus sp. PABB004]|nr:hypothetical protein HT031_004509 [Scenedesmus sp. PABB004]